jgi:PAS domain S-box-containing protein
VSPAADREFERAAALVEMAGLAFVSRTLEGVVTRWNEGAERIYGYDAGDVLGTEAAEIVPEDRVVELPSALSRIRRGESVERFETVRVRKDGVAIHVSVTMAPIVDADGTVVGVSAVERDVTELVVAAQERAELLRREQAAREEAERANRAKDAFIAVVSHEMRSPLNAMIMWVHLMRSSKMNDEDFRRALDTIERNIKSQSKLVDDLLDVSRIISGKLRLELRSVALVGVVEAAVDALRPTAEGKHVRLACDLDPLGGPVLADPLRLQQVFANLVGNAIKFTPAGGAVEMRLRRVASSAVVTVTDSGEGIAPEFLPYLFDRFRQADSAPSRAHGGLGLGLAIVRTLVELHGGTVEGRSDGVGKGATFTVRLPINALRARDLEAPGGAPTSDFSRLPSLAGLKVLVVDDDADAREALTRFLESRDADVRLVASAAEALKAIRHDRPDVLVSDIGMPGEDGYALMEQVRMLDREAGGRLPAVAVTAFASPEDRIRSLAAGFQMHLAKPVDVAELVMVIASLCGRLR